jgi:hypothetical protein
MAASPPGTTKPTVTNKRSNAARARWKAAVSLLQTYVWMLMGFVYLQGVLQPYRAPLWARMVEVGVALTLLALAVWLAPRGEE